MEKFAGVGLLNIFVIWACCTILSVLAKTLVTMYPIEGVSQVILTA